MNLSRPLRVLHCPLNTAGQPAALANAERQVGLQSWSAAWVSSKFAFPCDEYLWHAGISARDEMRTRRQLLRRALDEFDVIHFNWGESILPVYPPNQWPRRSLAFRPRQVLRHVWRKLIELRDVPLLKAAGKVIAVTFQGDDARQGDFIRANFDVSPAPYVSPNYYTAEFDAWKRKMIGVFDRHADLIYAVAADLLNLLPARAKLLRYTTVDPRDWAPRPAAPPNPLPVVVHAPTHREVKGTAFVIQAVEQLRLEGVAFEFVLVENLSHAEAKQAYRRADLLVDQLLVGNYGALAVELMALGVPVVSYVRETDLRFLPSDMRAEMPVISAHPGTIMDVLRSLLTVRKNELPEIGRRSRAFAERWYDPRAIARETAADYTAAWSARPRQLRHRVIGGASSWALRGAGWLA